MIRHPRAALLCPALAAAMFAGCATGVPNSATQGTAAVQGKDYSGHGAESVSEATLARFAPPALSPEVAAKVQTLLDIRAPGGGVLTSSGKKLFFSWNVTGSFQIWRLDSPKGFPVQMTGGEDRTAIEDVTPDGQWIILQRDRNGEENPGLYLQPVAGGPLRLIQHKKDVQTEFGFVTDDSKWIYFRANDLQPDSYALYRYNIDTGARELLFSENGIWSIADFKKDGTLLLRKETGALTSEFHEWSPKSRSLTPVIGQGEKEEYLVQYGARPGEFLVLTPKLGEFRRLYRFQDGKLLPLSPEMKHNVETFSIDLARKHLVYAVNENGYYKTSALDARTLKPIRLPAFPNAVHVYPGSMSRNGATVTLGITTAQAPRNYYSLNWKSGKLTQWVIPSAPEVDLTRFAKSTLESYPARDGTAIPMFVRRPTGCDAKTAATPCPVIVYFHGGPEGQSIPGFNPYAEQFIDAGFIFVEPNVRGSDGYGKKWLEADNGPKRLDVITDIEDCSKFIRANWRRNGMTPKIGILGGSYGGYSALIGMTMFGGAYDAGVSIVGISNMLTFLNNTAPYRRILRISEYGDPIKDHDALVRLSPTTYLDRVRAPLLMIQGASDPRVPVGEAIQIQGELAAKKIPSRLIVFPDEGHGSAKRRNQVLERGHTLEFFQEHLK